MRREELYLRDIVEAADRIAEFIVGCDFGAFASSELVRSAVVQKLGIIGEAASHVSESLKARYPETPWPRIIGFRNVLVHAYFGLDWSIVWDAATRQVPELSQQVAAILQAEFS